MMIKAEFHCHTVYSKDSLVKLEDLARVAQQKGLQRVVVTDHNNIEGAIKANKMDPARFIIGEEIMTEQGELIGIFMHELVPSGLSAQRTIELLRAQGAFINVAHPFDHYRGGHWKITDLLEIVPYIDAIEIFNSRCMDRQANKKAKEFALQHNLSGMVGSDSHSTNELGTATLTLPEFNDAESLKKSLVYAKHNVHQSPFWVHFYSRYASLRKKFS